jgi:ATP-dependent Clp protease adaptor protein ClpS
MTAPTSVTVPETRDHVDEDRPWQVVVWDDPVNTMSYVVFVFRKLFGYSKKKATRLMLQVHNEGRSAVSDGPREKVEVECYQLHSFGLWATIEQQ